MILSSNGTPDRKGRRAHNQAYVAFDLTGSANVAADPEAALLRALTRVGAREAK